MKKLIPILVGLSLISFLLVSCTGNKNVVKNTDKDELNENTEECSLEAQVIDYTGLSSCRFLLKLKDGSFVNPDGGVTIEELSKSVRANISYEEKPDVMSSCMRGKIVKITCFEVLEQGTPEKGKFE